MKSLYQERLERAWRVKLQQNDEHNKLTTDEKDSTRWKVEQLLNAEGTSTKQVVEYTLEATGSENSSI